MLQKAASITRTLVADLSNYVHKIQSALSCYFPWQLLTATKSLCAVSALDRAMANVGRKIIPPLILSMVFVLGRDKNLNNHRNEIEAFSPRNRLVTRAFIGNCRYYISEIGADLKRKNGALLGLQLLVFLLDIPGEFLFVVMCSVLLLVIFKGNPS